MAGGGQQEGHVLPGHWRLWRVHVCGRGRLLERSVYFYRPLQLLRVGHRRQGQPGAGGRWGRAGAEGGSAGGSHAWGTSPFSPWACGVGQATLLLPGAAQLSFTAGAAPPAATPLAQVTYDMDAPTNPNVNRVRAAACRSSAAQCNAARAAWHKRRRGAGARHGSIIALAPRAASPSRVAPGAPSARSSLPACLASRPSLCPSLGPAPAEVVAPPAAAHDGRGRGQRAGGEEGLPGRDAPQRDVLR